MTVGFTDSRRGGLLIAFEGLDQSGKQTQAELLRERLTARDRTVRLLSFPDYTTVIGAEIGRALHGERQYGADVMQLLYVANRYERKPDIERWLEGGLVLVCDRYVASSVAYGEALGLDPVWLTEMQRLLPAAALTILLEIAPETAVKRKAVDRDRYERDLALQARVRDSYRRQAAEQGWLVLDGERGRDAVAADVYEAAARLVAGAGD
jgi:dTMP kinase